MNPQDTPIDPIHAYLQGELDATAKAAFEEEMAANPDLAAAVELEREVIAAIHLDRQIQLKQMLMATDVEAIEEDQAPQTPPTNQNPRTGGGGIIRPPFLKMILLASGFAACIVAAIFLMRGTPADGQALFKANYETYDEVDVEKGASDLTAGYAEYLNHDWAAAIPLLADSLSESLLLRANAEIELGKFQDARRDLETIIQREQGKIVSKATWYLALVDLHENRIEDCRQHLKALIDRGDYNPGLAKELLAKLPAAP